MKGTTFSSSDVKKIATLANLPVTNDQAIELAKGFTKTMKVVEELTKVDVTHTEPTNQVTSLENIFREDEIDTTRMLTQDQALAGAKRKHNGLFVVDQILED